MPAWLMMRRWPNGVLRRPTLEFGAASQCLRAAARLSNNCVGVRSRSLAGKKDGSGVALQLMGQQLQQLNPFYFLRGVEWSYQAVAGCFQQVLGRCSENPSLRRWQRNRQVAAVACKPRTRSQAACFQVAQHAGHAGHAEHDDLVKAQSSKLKAQSSKLKAQSPKPKAQSPRQAELAQARADPQHAEHPKLRSAQQKYWLHRESKIL